MSQRSSYSDSRRGSGRRFFRRVWEFSWKAGLTLLIPLICAIGWYAYQANKFDLALVAKMPERTVLIDRNGTEFATIHGSNRRLIGFEEIPEFLKTALFAREDARFMDHEGVDFRGLARATVRNLKDRDFTQGASTLSMQLARNTFDLREKKSLNRKFLEIALTYRVESKYTKPEILTHYLNRIYFGAGCNGIEEAALHYFGRSTSELTRGQCALLVGIIRAPHLCSPSRNREGAIKQRDEVLDRLVTTGSLSETEADTIKAEPLELIENDSPSSESHHAMRALRRPLEVVLDKNQITTGGLRVICSIELDLQKDLENLVTTTPLPSACQMAAVALDPKNGDVLAVVGSREKKPTGFNRALDARRDLGPTLVEPLIGTISLERGHLPIDGNPLATGRQLEQGDARQLLQRFGLDGRFGKGEDLFRGSLTVSPLALATAYATLLSKGSRPDPVFVKELIDDTETLFTREPSFFPAFSESSRLSTIPKFLSGYSLPSTDFWAATLSDDKIIVIWVGYDTPSALELDPAVRDALEKNLQAFGP
jgi:penicillin-binding protein 1A